MTKTVKQTCSKHSHLGKKVCGNHVLACVCTPLPVMEGGKHYFTGGAKSTLKPEASQSDPRWRDSLVTQLESFQANLPIKWVAAHRARPIRNHPLPQTHTHSSYRCDNLSEGRCPPLMLHLWWNANPEENQCSSCDEEEFTQHCSQNLT